MIGIIGGSGLYDGISGLKGKKVRVSTPYGDVKVILGENFVFVSRHGNPPKPPHRVNYHANIMAFKKLNVEKILAISSVGSLKDDIPPGTLMLPDDLLDFTGRVWTYHDDGPVHINMYEPFCPELRYEVSKIEDVKIGGTYATMKGPQFETRAEERMLKILGADVVGMTVAPESKLAKELEICYQPLCVVVNYVGSETSHEETLKNMAISEAKIENVLGRILK